VYLCVHSPRQRQKTENHAAASTNQGRFPNPRVNKSTYGAATSQSSYVHQARTSSSSIAFAPDNHATLDKLPSHESLETPAPGYDSAQETLLLWEVLIDLRFAPYTTSRYQRLAVCSTTKISGLSHQPRRGCCAA
jgi:hypothetical protein